MNSTSRNQQIEELKTQDKILIQELTDRLQKRVSPLPELVPFIESSSPFTFDQLTELEQLLKGKRAFDIQTTYMDWEDIDGTKYHLPILKAAGTGMWPMGTNWYARDNVLIPIRLLEVSQSSLLGSKEYAPWAKELLISALTMFSSVSQLKRFQQVIESTEEYFIHQRENWPMVFLTIKDNLNASRYEPWSHKQDAWQMLAYHTLDLIERGLFSVHELSDKHKQFLASAVPFLAKVQFWKEENGGSWEELAARRSSVIAWDTAAVKKIADFVKRPEGKFLSENFERVKDHLPVQYQTLSLGQTAEMLITEGKQALRARLPHECPDYDKADPRYREADAALIYLLQLDMPAFLEDVDLEEAVVAQIERLTDARTGGIRRYLNDSYQGKGFFRNEVVFYVSEISGAPSGDASGADEWVRRSQLVPKGFEAVWTHFVWQMSAWSGKRYGETRDKKYRDMQEAYFKRGLKLITSKNEVSLEQTPPNGPMRVFDVPAWRIPEAYITDEGPNGEELIFPSPHTPLNWAIGEAIYAFAMMKKSLEIGAA